MFRIIGIVCVSVAIAVIVQVADFFMPGNFLNNFIGSEFIQMFAAILGFNFAAIIFLLGQLFVINNSGKELFAESKREIKQNGIFLLSAFSASLVLLVVRPDFNEQLAQYVLPNGFYYAINTIILTLFILSLFAVYEILSAAFLLTNKPQQ